MTWTTPVAGIAGQIVTAAWSQANVVDPLNWLRLLTGNADPPGSGYLILSLTSSQTIWGKLQSDYIQDGAVTDAKLNDPKVSKTLSNYGSMAVAAANGTGFSSSFQSSSNLDGPVTSDWFVTTANLGTRQLQTITSIYDENLSYIRLVVSGTPTSWKQVWHSGNDGSGSGLDADLLDGQSSAFYATASSVTALTATVAAINAVPSGLIAAVDTAAAIPSGWTRFSNGDGRMLIGAGTTFSQTFTENTAAGTGTWTPLSGTSVPADGTHTFLAASSATNNATGATSVSTAPHDHAIPTTTWIPPVRVVVHVKKS